MKPINQNVWQAANTAEWAGCFNRASGGSPISTGRGPWDAATYIRHGREAEAPCMAWAGTIPGVLCRHRCMIESQGKRSGFGATSWSIGSVSSFFSPESSWEKEMSYVIPSCEHWPTCLPQHGRVCLCAFLFCQSVHSCTSLAMSGPAPCKNFHSPSNLEVVCGSLEFKSGVKLSFDACLRWCQDW